MDESTSVDDDNAASRPTTSPPPPPPLFSPLLYALKGDEFLYVFILVFSILLGFYVRRIEDARRRRSFSSLVGLSLVVFFCRHDALYSLFAAIVNAAIVQWAGRRRAGLTFIFSFAFLGLFRCATWLGLPRPCPLSNAVQLIMTLKSIALAFEVTDAEKAEVEFSKISNEEKEKDSLENDDSSLRLQRLAGIRPNVVDSLSYSFCYIGLFTGPFFKYRTWLDWSENAVLTRSLSTRNFILQRLAWIPVLAAIHVTTKIFFPLDYVSSPLFEAENSFWRRSFYMMPTFVIFRSRMYVAWLLAECMAVTAAFGAYPAQSQSRPGDGPQNLVALKQLKFDHPVHFDFNTIRNIDVLGVETKSTARSAMRCWNMSVQFWLAQFVYKRFPIRRLGTFVTMLVSAFWHGVHAGYYLSFLTVPLVAAVDDLWSATVRTRLEEGSLSLKIYDATNWFLRCRAYDYMCMGFLLLSYDRTMAYWSSTYFLIHLVYLSLLAIILAIRCTTFMRWTKKSD